MSPVELRCHPDQWKLWATPAPWLPSLSSPTHAQTHICKRRRKSTNVRQVLGRLLLGAFFLPRHCAHRGSAIFIKVRETPAISSEVISEPMYVRTTFRRHLSPTNRQTDRHSCCTFFTSATAAKRPTEVSDGSVGDDAQLQVGRPAKIIHNQRYLHSYTQTRNPPHFLLLPQQTRASTDMHKHSREGGVAEY